MHAGKQKCTATRDDPQTRPERFPPRSVLFDRVVLAVGWPLVLLATAESNSCQYCVSAHSAIGRKTGLNGDEINANRAGSSQDARAAVAVKFANALSEHKGQVTNAEIQEVRDAGYSDADIVEIITHLAFYSGWPTAMTAAAIAKDVFAQRED